MQLIIIVKRVLNIQRQSTVKTVLFDISFQWEASFAMLIKAEDNLGEHCAQLNVNSISIIISGALNEHNLLSLLLYLMTAAIYFFNKNQWPVA